MVMHQLGLITLIILTNLCVAKLFYQHLEPHEARRIAIETYIYGYSLVTSEVTRIQMTNSTEHVAVNTPMGVFNNLRNYPPATYHGVVAPNADTLYSIAWIDLDSEPWFFSHPNMNNRFYLFPIYTLWMNILDDPGARTTGTAAATYALIGPKWRQSLPKNVQVKLTKIIYSPTRYVVILGRTYCTGTQEDYKVVHQLQDQYLLRPLSMFIQNENETYKVSNTLEINDNLDPPFNTTGSVRDVIKHMNITTYFNIIATLIQDNLPSTEDLLMIIQMSRIGLVAGKTFNLSVFESSVQAAILEAPKIAFDLITAYKIRIGVIVNNWIILNNTASFGAHYLLRAAVAMYGWGANKAEDAIYPTTNVDSTAHILLGTNQYVLHIPQSQTPPVHGFWSFTMYDSDLFFVPNSLNRYRLSSQDSLVYNADGSLDLYFQKTSPGRDKEPNWLPAPEGNFNIMLRMYWPQISVHDIVNGTWLIPSIIKVS